VFIILAVTIAFGAIVITTIVRKAQRSIAVDYVDQCLQLATSNYDNPSDFQPIGVDEIQTSKAIPVCSKAIEADPQSRTLKYYLSRAYESERSLESLRKSKDILLELAAVDYPLANWKLYLFSDRYTQLGMSSVEEKYSYLKAAADAGFEAAVAEIIEELRIPESAFYDLNMAREYEEKAINNANLQFFEAKPDLFLVDLDEWQRCYATILAPTGLSLPSLIFYEPDKMSPYGFLLPSNDQISEKQRLFIKKACKNISSLSPSNARDVALQLALPYFFEGKALEPERVLSTLRSYENLKDFGFLAAGIFKYTNSREDSEHLKASPELEKYLLGKLHEYLNSNDLYKFAIALNYVENLNYMGMSPSFYDLLQEPEFKEKFKLAGELYDGYFLDLIWDNQSSFGNSFAFLESFFSDFVKYDYFCAKIVELNDDGELIFPTNSVKGNFPGFSEVSTNKLVSFCSQYVVENNFLKLDDLARKAGQGHYIYNDDSNLRGFARDLVKVHNEVKYDYYRGYSSGEFKPINYVINVAVQNILHANEMDYFDEDFLLRALFSKDFLANPLMLLNYAMEVDRILDNEQRFTTLAASYVKKNFPFYLPDTYAVKGLSCDERFKLLSASEPISSSESTDFFNDIWVEISIDRLLDFSLKDRTISMSVTTTEEAIDVNNLSVEGGVRCQEMLSDVSGNPTSVTSSLKYTDPKNDLMFDFRTAIDRPEILASTFLMKDYQVGRVLRSNLELTFDPESLKLKRYPFINGQIAIPLDIIVKKQANRFVTARVVETFDTKVAGLRVSLERMEFSERENYPDALEANLLLKVKNNYFIQLLKIVFPILVLATVALTTLPRQKASSNEAQLSLASAVMLSVIAFQFVVNSLLPELPFLTALDYFIYALYVSAAFSVVSNVILHIEYFDTRPRQEKSLVLLTNSSAITFYLIGIIVLINAWYQSFNI